MSKTKSALVTTIVMILVCVILYFAWDRAIRVWNVLEFIFFGYGVIRFAIDFNHWMERPSQDNIQEPAWEELQ